jgi:pimeloyl-ACP methyl ester carboxylesterase
MRSDDKRRLQVLTAALIAGLAMGSDAWPQAAGLQPDVRFDKVSPLSSNVEMARRLLTPLAAAQLPKRLAKAGKVLAEQPIDPTAEHFVLYVPAQAPPMGYGLLVFVPPWQEASLPKGWGPVLDRLGLIFVSAARSGNDESLLGRREPLAVIAAANVISRYRIDPERIYVSGFSGGSRMAMRLALGYPDLFRGALLNAGSDPIGSAEIPLPPRDLFYQFQSGSRLVYLTGSEDQPRQEMELESSVSMRFWCVFDIDRETITGAGHDLAGTEPLARGLKALERHAPADPARLAACRESVEKPMSAQLDQAERLIAAGKREDARRLLGRVDGRFGGLAAPRSVDLAARAADKP